MPAPTITPAAVQAALGSTPMNATITHARQTDVSSTAGCYYVIGNCDAPGRARWCDVTNTDSAATQAAAILVKLRQ